MNYIETIRKNLASDNTILRDLTLNEIASESIVPVEVTNDLMELCATNKDLRESVFINCDAFPKNERTIDLLLQWVDELDSKTKKLVQLFLDNTPAALLVKKEQELAVHISKNTMDFAKKLVSFEGATGDDLKPLWKEYKNLLTQLAQSEKMAIFQKATKVQDVLIKNGEFNDAKIQEMLNEELGRTKLSAKGILAVRAIGLLKLDAYIPQLTSLLTRYKEEILLSVVVDTLIKLDEEQVVNALQPHVLNEVTFYDAISVLKEIRTPLAEKVLLEALDENPSEEIQEALYAALAGHLSPALLPLMDQYIAVLQEIDFPEQEELLYLYHMSVNATHAELEQWHTVLKEKEDALRAENTTTSFADAIRDEEGKVGRNDPCVCGSGKKFKKCCGKEA